MESFWTIVNPPGICQIHTVVIRIVFPGELEFFGASGESLLPRGDSDALMGGGCRTAGFSVVSLAL